MSLIEEYYELNEAEEVAAIWKILQIGFYGASAGLGLWCGFTMATLRLKFGDRCYLFTRANKYVKRVESVNDLDWASDTWCDYYQFTFVSSFIVGIIWAAFFLMCGKGGRSLTGLPQPWRIIWPSLVFNLAFFLIILGTSTKVQQGTYHFCKPYNEEKELHKKCLPRSALVRNENFEMTEFQMNIVPKTAWGCTMCWLTLFLLSLFRIIFLIDFRMYRICVFRIDDTIQNKREEVLRVTNYEEPKKLQFVSDPEGATYQPTHQPSHHSTHKIESILSNPKVASVVSVELPEDPNKEEKVILPHQQPSTAFYLKNDKRLSKQRKSKTTFRDKDRDRDRDKEKDRDQDENLAKKMSIESRDPHPGRPIFRKYSKHGHETDREDDDSPTTTPKVSFKEERRKKSDPENVASDSSSDESRSLSLKKQI